MMGPINLTNINLSLSLSPVRCPLTLTEEQKLKNYQDHRSKRIRKNCHPHPPPPQKKKHQTRGTLSHILMWVLVLVE